MRVLICDQESEMLETVAREFDVDTATSKATCIDLMRANPFDVVIASERLSDGSGLELLSHIATRWPDTLRVLVIEPERLRLLRGKLAPFRLQATMRYPIEEDELETVLNRMDELMGAAEEEADGGPDPEPGARPAKVPPTVPKVPLPQRPTQSSSVTARVMPGAAAPRPAVPDAERAVSMTAAVGVPGSAGSPRAPSQRTAQSAKNAPALGAPVAPAPPVVRRKLGNYTPLGAPADEQLRIVEREFDQTAAPLAARAIRSREEATRSRTSKEKLSTLTTLLRDSLKKLLRR